jgi:hypothetical protein
MPFDWLPHLAADAVVPAWLAREYGYSGPARYTWLAPYPGAPRKVRVWWVSWLPVERVNWLPHNLRHALITAVARRALEASPEGWDNLVVWDSRRTPRGRRWARDNRDSIRWARERGGARPDAEWWPEGSRGPWAVEVDTGRWDPALLARRAEAWRGLYEGQVWVVLSFRRASVLGEWLLRAGVAHKPVRLLVVRNWWEGLDYEEVW